MCGEQFTLSTQDSSESDLSINESVVSGMMAIGCGFYNMEELFSCIGVPSMSFPTYKKHHDNVANHWNKAAVEAMKVAAEEEKKHAVEINSVDKDGYALVPVVADGTWGKRSNKNNYNSLSGAAAIVGVHSRKVLYLGVKNKFCFVCTRHDGTGTAIPEHNCTKTHTGSSGSMEPAVILEGFKSSVEMYNIKYNILIGDGDSSTYKKIIDGRPYENLTVQKIECRNHLLRNLRTKLHSLTNDKRFCIQDRKLLKCRILRLSNGIRAAISYRKTENRATAEQDLKVDILNSANHVFGEHKECNAYFCNKKDEQNLMLDLSREFIVQLKYLVQSVANHTRSLIFDVDNNVVEQFNSIIAKFVGGKRINYAFSNSYEARCIAAVVSHNTRMAHSFMRQSLDKNPNRLIVQIEEKRQNKVAQNALRSKSQPGKKHFSSSSTTKDQDYGEQCQKPDMPPEVYEANKNLFLEQLQRSEEELEGIERDTVSQGQSGKWIEERRKLLTASNFAKVCKRRRTTSCISTVKRLLYQPELNVPAINHGKTYENAAREQLLRQMKIDLYKECGLFIDREHYFLGATPDGLLGVEGIIEIKCPWTAFKSKMSPDAAIQDGKISFWNKNTFEVDKNHDWYYQIQGQLHVTQKDVCLLGVWTGYEHELKTELIVRDDGFWKDRMEKKLVDFYMSCLLPELVDPRHTRNMPIRDNQETSRLTANS